VLVALENVLVQNIYWMYVSSWLWEDV